MSNNNDPREVLARDWAIYKERSAALARVVARAKILSAEFSKLGALAGEARTTFEALKEELEKLPPESA